MNNSERVVKFLGKTDGRDQMYKSLDGMFEVLADIATKNQDPRAKSYIAIGRSINSARSLMRMGKFIGDFAKLRAIGELVSAQGFKYTENKKFVEFARVVCDSLYVFGDNVAFMARFNLALVPEKVAAEYAKIAQFWGFLLAVILDLFELRDGLRRLEYDPPAAKRASKTAALCLVRDTSDVLVTMPAAGYLLNVWHPSGTTTGSLTFASGLIAMYLIWEKIK